MTTLPENRGRDAMTNARPPGAVWRRWIISALLLGLPAAALYWLTAGWPDTPDGLFHLHRVRALAEALRMGVLYPRWYPDFAFGYGYPVLNFYAPAFYYPPAILHLTGLDLIVAVRVTLAACYALSGLGAYALLRCWTRPMPAALGATLYLVYPYRLYDLFVRGALPEFAAFLWLPLIGLTTVRWLEASGRRGSDRPAWHWVGGLTPIAFSWAGLILTHNLTALMAGIAVLFVAGLLSALYLAKWVRGGARGDIKSILSRCARAFALPPVLGGLLSAPYAVPALLESGWVGVGAVADGRGYAAHFVTLRELYDHALIYRYPDAAQPTVPVPGYAAILLLVVVAVLFLPLARGRRVVLGISAGLALFTLWLSTVSSAFVWDGLAPVLGKLQFPWRWQTLAALALGCSLGLVLDIGGRWQGVASRPRVSRLVQGGLAVALGAYLVLQSVAGLDFSPALYRASDLTPQQMWAFDAQHGQVGATWAGEFLPRWVSEQRWALGREPSEGRSGAPAGETPAATRSARLIAQGYLGERLLYEASAPGQLVFHAFYYPAWRVEIDGQVQPTRPEGDLGLLAVDLPAGQHEVARRWGFTPAARVGLVLGVTGWLVVSGILVIARDPRRWLNTGLWLLVAAVAVLEASGWLAREQLAAPVGIDYGHVRLESAVAPPARAGEIAWVTLHWLVTAAPEPLTAFVHLVAPDGRMVVGDDAPLGGPYTPASRWLMGELLRDDRALFLPEDLPPDTYLLKAGLYRPGESATPLFPSGVDPTVSRVDVGVLEVRP